VTTPSRSELAPAVASALSKQLRMAAARRMAGFGPVSAPERRESRFR
jgi:hypothetical protein